MNTGKKILVTGGAGYIGSILSEKILAANYHLVIFDNFSITDEGIQNLKPKHHQKIINGDLRNIEQWKDAVNGVDTIIHLAGVSDGKSGERNPALTKEINQTSFPALVVESKKAGVSRFILASTFGVYGNHYGKPLTENLEVNPVDSYSESKVFGEKVLQENNSNDFTTSSLRIAMVYGVSHRMRFDFIVNNLVIKALTENKLTVYGGSQKRPQIHIQDITNYLLNFIQFDKELISGKVYNAGGQNYSIRKIVDSIKDSIGNIQIEYLPSRKNEYSFDLDSTRIKQYLKLKPKHSIENGINEIKEAYYSGLWRNINKSKYYNYKRDLL